MSEEYIELADAKFMDRSNVVPRIEVQHGKDFVPWGDKGKNDYPKKLISLVDGSALHNAIVVNKAWQVAGGGLTFPEDGPQSKATAEFLSEINAEGEDANEVLSKAAFDLEIFNGVAMLVTWSRDWSRVVEVEHIEFGKIRAAKPDEYGRVRGYYYSFDWDTYRPTRVYIPIFDPKGVKEKSKDYKQALQDYVNNNEGVDKRVLEDTDRTQILVMKQYRPDSFFYPVPSYAGAITSVEADIEADNFALSSMKNGLSAPFMLHIPSNGGKKEKLAFMKDFKATYTGSKAANLPIFAFYKPDQNGGKPEITKLDSQGVNKQYTAVNENSLQKILAGHRVPNANLVGILTPGSLGGGDQIKEAQQLFFNTVIQPNQLFITKAFNKIMKANDLETVSILELDPFGLQSDEADGQESGNNSEISDGDEMTGKTTGTEKEEEVA